MIREWYSAPVRVTLALVLSMAALISSHPVSPETLEERIRAIAAGFTGELGVFAKNLRTGETAGWNADTPFPTASVIKVAVMVEAFDQIARGSLQPDAIVPLREAAKVGGSGVLRELHDGTPLTVRDLIRLMIVVSDNTATNLLLERVGTQRVNARMDAYGLRQTRIFRPTFGRTADVLPELEREFGLGMSTPREMGALMEMIAEGRAVGPSASKEMLGILERQQDVRMIPRRLPFDGPAVTVANKTGTDSEKLPDASGRRGHVRADVAIVRTPDARFAIAIFARRVTDESWMPDNAALVTGAAIARAVFDRFAARP